MRLALAVCLAVAASGLLAQETFDDRAILQARVDLIEGRVDEALAVLRPAAEAGNPRAQHLYGTVFQYGDTDVIDPEQALQWYSLAAEQNYPSAMYATGILYRYGLEGLEADPVRARAFFEEAAAFNYGPALAELGVMLSNGIGGAADVDLAILYLKLGADLGDMAASSALGYQYDHGIGVPQDLEEARRLYTISAVQGDYMGQNNLGYFAANGRGGPQDVHLAAENLRASMAQGFDLAAANLAELIVAVPSLDPRPLSGAAHCVWAQEYATQRDASDVWKEYCTPLVASLSESERKEADKLAQGLVPG